MTPPSAADPGPPPTVPGPSVPQQSEPTPGGRQDRAVADGLRSLAHPVRVRLLGLLRRHGPATATGLARDTGLTSGATSYHLRRLAAAGLVEEADDRGNARERWWRSTYRATHLHDARPAGHEPGAAPARLRAVAAAHAVRVQQTVGELEALPVEWRQVVDLGDVPLLLTPEEAGRLRAELWDLVGRFRRDVPALRATAPADAARVTVMAHVLPDPNPDPDPGPDPDPDSDSDSDSGPDPDPDRGYAADPAAGRDRRGS
ncbi:helix-turn-helix domain-containing protein [Streptomyces sp. MP131-18]|uniref:helix-turn-helix domain-containing protein n=1 Tax=Streptomyces sp. MP131-18 TaxID=1857892 RepID=UPI00097C74C9|nr:helix-turn-helix domain-containing protein [Streptomyces sp. MP131-18]ONK14538.1 Helix-turn-helix domain protein [Streptomyces sp. MP131-18]